MLKLPMSTAKMPIDPNQVRSILATDCGSTTTKAILIEKQPDGTYRLVCRGEAPTTVEAPFDDVTIGVTNAIREVEELRGRRLLDDSGKPLTPQQEDGSGVDLYLSTSSAGGGLQMTVIGVVKRMSAESAQRAALGAGAIVIDVLATDDGRKDFERVERLRQLRPDILLMAGGTDGGTVIHLVEMAEMLLAADPRPRLGHNTKLPVIYAGNPDAYPQVAEILKGHFDLRQVPNLRPTLERENLGPAREAIHEVFLQHVMQQAPGYSKLLNWTSADIMSTPNAVGKIMQTIAEQQGINLLGVDIGGATTDVFSVFDGHFTRTVSANLGMSYSICNVLAEAKIDRICRWLPFPVEASEVRNQLRNKMIRPTTIPQLLTDLLLEQAVCREALALAFEHHKSLARDLFGVAQAKNVGQIFEQKTSKSLINMLDLDVIVGSGGVLSHAPLRAQAALMMLDAFQPEGFTLLTVDSIFMMPQLGVLSTLHPEAATHVFQRDCLIYLGTCIAPIGVSREGEPCITVEWEDWKDIVPFGALRVYPLGLNSAGEPEEQEITVTPSRAFDLGAGRGRAVRRVVKGGVVGLIVDARGRPLQLPTDPSARLYCLQEWYRTLNIPLPQQSQTVVEARS
ncbi:MAG TPA: glutamate mutase L [Chthonomonas sp.]|nr:glutamate mutase L [Chthonomonas sp.]HLI49105.1 glutamate mutase L [Chthonomonas sp.]